MRSAPLAASLPVPVPAPSAPEPGVALPATAWPALIEYLTQVPDPRDPRGRRHPLPAVLALVCCALLCGARHLQAICDWGRDHSPSLAPALGFPRPTTPCCATLHTVLAALDWSALEQQLRAWSEAAQAAGLRVDPLGAEEALAVDGKTRRGALKMNAAVTQLVSAVGHRLGLTAGAVEVTAGDEIAAVETLLRELVLEGKVVTLDALHTQADTARLIRAKGGHYLLTVKGNQPHLQEAVHQLFRPEHARQQDRQSASTAEHRHGRSESRWLACVSLPADGLGWPGAVQAFVIERRVWKSKQQTAHRELVYGITSLTRAQAGAADLLRLNRGHWGIENRSHWVRDVLFGEDAGLACTGRLPQTLALLRTAVINRLRLAHVPNLARETRRLAAQPWDCLRLLGLAADN
jgi:predicted transposase YbfD/YdcC